MNDACDYFNYGNFDVMKKLSSIYDFKDEIYAKMESHNLSVYSRADKMLHIMQILISILFHRACT